MKFYSAEIILKKKQVPAIKQVKPPDLKPVPAQPQAHIKESTIKNVIIIDDEIIKKVCWLSEIETLENYFNTICNYQKNVRLDVASVINDPALFLDSHFQTLKANNGNRYYLPYLDRLKKYRLLIEKKELNCKEQ